MSAKDQGSNLTGGAISQGDNKRAGEEIMKRRKISLAEQEPETSIPGDDFFTISPLLVKLGDGVRITAVAAGGRHTLALSGKYTVLDHQNLLPRCFRFRCQLFVVTLHSFVDCMKYKAMEEF